MELVLNWVSTHLQVFGFGVATVIFLFTVFLASRQYIGFFITLLFLLFALLTGFLIVNHDVIREYMEVKVQERKLDPDGSLGTFKSDLLDKYDNMQNEFQVERDKFQKHYDEEHEKN